MRAMTTSKVVLAVVVCVVAVLAASSVVQCEESRCGHDANGMECPRNLCCSKWGHCGLGAPYCGDGCQSGACYTTRPCGKDNFCPGNMCCSRYGRCGFGSEYCAQGCQSGPCRADIKCGAGAGGGAGDLYFRVCPNNWCCSKWGYCGLGTEFCGAGCQSGACIQDKAVDVVVPEIEDGGAPTTTAAAGNGSVASATLTAAV